MPVKYSFDPSKKHHLFVGLGLAVWIFIFLYFTEPLDVNELTNTEKLMYLPIYGLVGAMCYISMLPVQSFLYTKNKKQWYFTTETIFLLLFMLLGLLLSRSFYLYIVMKGEPNPYTLGYYIKNIYAPAILTILPIVIIGRWSFGKYNNKKLEDQKVEIKGVGTYENLRLFFNDILCIQSSDNYVEVSYLDNGQLKKHLIRNTLSTIGASFPQLLQTHRSFLINPYHFKQWKTEKSKLIIILAFDIAIPISRTFQTQVKEHLHSTTK
ncbi:LytTR family DNA-binding domain-containing protein [Aquimarina sp. 2201CG14-23]|uniref:LytTR family DNA-binding domain-containing protein n=1 Tax=Aquimarina mycalae TaxID=3040073 RepID=UPI002477EC3F|nr:LytTR family DNA-binding domain-containing protein [Aquimarina sp. 2201CG14-23]MDH7444099.1 LytTR family DNA-binding domain-containing protein [Aquimarina sp. 2201CG14-23]